jgi:hypothetical protein
MGGAPSVPQFRPKRRRCRCRSNRHRDPVGVREWKLWDVLKKERRRRWSASVILTRIRGFSGCCFELIVFDHAVQPDQTQVAVHAPQGSEALKNVPHRPIPRGRLVELIQSPSLNPWKTRGSGIILPVIGPEAGRVPRSAVPRPVPGRRHGRREAAPVRRCGQFAVGLGQQHSPRTVEPTAWSGLRWRQHLPP